MSANTDYECLLHTLLDQLSAIRTLPSSISTISMTVVLHYPIHVREIRADISRYVCGKIYSECIRVITRKMVPIC